MLEQLIKYLSTYIETGQPDSVHVYGLAHRLRRIEEGKTKEFPAIYCANDEYHNIEHDIPFLYIRQRAAISESESNDGNAPSGCDDTIIRTYPMTLVGYIPKNIYNKDNAYSDERISGNIANTIDILSWKVLITALQVSDINLNIRNIDTDRWSVWSKEYREIGMAARLDHAYFSIDFDLSVTAVQSCLRNYECGDEPINPNPCSNLKSTAILKDTDGNIISVTLIPAGQTADITAPDATIQNSDLTYTDSVLSGGTLVLPDQDIEVNNSLEGAIPSVGTIDINLTDGVNPVTPDAVTIAGRVVTIEVPSMEVDFSADKILATGGEVINFTDLSNQSPTEWAWNFNGEGVSSQQNPSFVFNSVGQKTISLFASNANLGGSEVKPNYITIQGLINAFPTVTTGYSFRLLNTSYAGSCIRVRRSSDNAESNIVFLSGVLDVAALLAFVGVGDGFVTTWYDQSGNGNNAVQATSANQPQIVRGGTIITDNGKPCMLFDGINDSMQSLFAIGTAMTRFFVFNHRSAQNNQHIMLDNGAVQDAAYLLFSSTNTLRIFGGLSIFYSGLVFNNNQNLSYNLFDGVNGALNINGQTPTTGALSGLTFNGVTIGRRGGAFQQFFANMTVQELIIYPSNQSANRVSIETNINGYYGIY
jgi:PKD repeat protein